MTYARRAIMADMEAVVAMARMFHAESPLHSDFAFNESKVRQLVEAAIANTDWLPLVAMDDDGLCGMALIYAMPMFFSDALAGGDLAFYVPASRRGTLAAARMMEEIGKWSVSRGVAVLDIGVNTGINHDKAVSFFGKCGFRQIGTIMRQDMG